MSQASRLTVTTSGSGPERRKGMSDRMSAMRARADVLCSMWSFVEADPNVWSGRASQEAFVELAVRGLASMYPAFDWSVVLRAIMDISAPAISLADRPQRAIRVTSVRMRREDRSSISSHPLADLGR